MKIKAQSILYLLTALVLCTAVQTGVAQNNSQANADTYLDGREVNTITTAVPFLRIAPDARAGAMGDAGIAISPDANSMHWNPAKYAFAKKDFGISVSYTPWLRALELDDIFISYLAAYKQIDNTQTIGGSLRYFSLGNIQFTNLQGDPEGEFTPHEFALDGTYARKLSENFSTALALRFIYSNLASGQAVNGETIHPGTAVAADIATYYNKDIRLSEKAANIAFGANISNIGSKITYTKSADKDFIPINLGLGSAFLIEFDDYNEMTFTLDFNKLLVPTPIVDSVTGLDLQKNKPVISGMLGSFTDAPGGFSEEINEIMYSFGAEYWYDQQFAIRSGYFYEHPTKGNRQFATFGVGLKYNVFEINVAYLVSTNGQQNPLNNTLRFSLLFNFDALKGTTDQDQGNTASL